MIRTVVLLAAICFISASLGSEESCYLTEEQEDECASVCYPIVKPLLRYFEKCQTKDSQTLQLQSDYSDLKDRYSELQNKYEKLQSKSLEVDYLKAIIDLKNVQIDLLNDKISGLKEKSELGILTDQFRENIANLNEIIKNGEISKHQNTIKNNQVTSMIQNKKLEGNTHSNNNITEVDEVKPGAILTNHLNSTRNQIVSKTPPTIKNCPKFQNNGKILQEIHIPGLDPFKVVCYSKKEIGSGWIVVYQKYFYSNMFNLKYAEYATGFGERERLVKDFFLGLERLHQLTKGRPHELVATPFKGKCNNFELGNQSEGYMVKSIGECTGNLQLGFRQGTKFSTFDRDEDGDADHNWAQEKAIGWWFHSGNKGFFGDTIIHMMIRRQV